jgi:hypothetical protein
MDTAAKRAVAAGLAKLADAIHNLREAQGAVETGLRDARPGSDAEALVLGLARVLGHLGEAVVDVTPEMWAAMLSEQSIGLDDVRKAFEAAA